MRLTRVGLGRIRRALLLLVMLAGAACASQRDDEVEIRGAFGDFKEALISADSGAAAELVAAASLERFRALQELALYASHEELQQRPPVDQMLVLVLRLRSEGPALQAMSPRQVLAFLLEQRALGREYDAASEIDEIVLGDEQATARHVKYGQVVRARLRFVRDPEGWRQDLSPILAAMAADFDRMVGGRRRGRAAAIRAQSLVEIAFQERLEPRHLEPLIAAASSTPGTHQRTGETP